MHKQVVVSQEHLEPQNFICNILARKEKVMIKPGFVCHVRVYQMDLEPLVHRDT